MDFNILLNILKDDFKLIMLAVVCVIIDFVLGFTKAIVNKTFSSNKLRSGLVKIIQYVGFFVLFLFIQWVFPTFLTWDIGDYTLSLSMITLFIIVFIEITSIGENSNDIPLIHNLITKFTDFVKNSTPISSITEVEVLEDENE